MRKMSMSSVVSAIKASWNRNVRVDAVGGAGEWEAIDYATAPVMRHRGCGALVRIEYLSDHLRESHSKMEGAIIRLYSDGSNEALATKQFRLTHAQTMALFEFIKAYGSESKVVSGPWVN